MLRISLHQRKENHKYFIR